MCLSRPGIVSNRVTRLSVTIIFLSVAGMPENRRPPQTTPGLSGKLQDTLQNSGTDSKTAEQHCMCIFRVNVRQINITRRLRPNYSMTYILMYLTSGVTKHRTVRTGPKYSDILH